MRRCAPSGAAAPTATQTFAPSGQPASKRSRCPTSAAERSPSRRMAAAGFAGTIAPMTAVAAVGQRVLPRGWSDLGRQLGIWFGFALLYQFARGMADRNPAKALANGHHVVDIETRFAHR